MAREKPTSAAEDPAEQRRYFRRLFKSRPELLTSRTDVEAATQWLEDHPDQTMISQVAKQALLRVKRDLGRKAALEQRKASAAQASDTAVQEGGHPAESPSGYFRRFYQKRPELLTAPTDEEAINQWLADHPDHREMPPAVRQSLLKVKSALRARGARKQRKADAARAQAGARGPENVSADVRYFRRFFEGRPDLVRAQTNEEAEQQWLTDHPGRPELSEIAKQALLIVKLALVKEAARSPEASAPPPPPEAEEEEASPVEGPSDHKRYFRRFFKDRPELLDTNSNEEVIDQWLADHPGVRELPPVARQALFQVKAEMRFKANRKKR
jgi:hypothetical protein